jgi:hypothetical protein
MRNSHRLAAMLAERLLSVMPHGLAVHADGDEVDVRDDRGSIGGSASTIIVDDDDGRSLEEKIEMASWAVLSGVQDVIAEELRQEWPVLEEGGMALPGVSRAGHQLHLWFGKEATPVLRLRSINLADFGADF